MTVNHAELFRKAPETKLRSWEAWSYPVKENDKDLNTVNIFQYTEVIV